MAKFSEATLVDRRMAEAYLCGELSPENIDRIEDALISDTEYGEWLQDVENGFVDRYVNGEMIAEEIIRFEKSYLNNERRSEKAYFAHSLALEIHAAGKPKQLSKTSMLSQFAEFVHSLRQVGFTAGALASLLVLAGGYFVWQSLSSRDEKEMAGQVYSVPALSEPQGELPMQSSPIATQDRLSDVVKNKTGKPPVEQKTTVAPKNNLLPRSFAILLQPITRKAAAVEEIVISPGTENIRFIMEVAAEDNFPKYEVLVTDMKGDVIASANSRRRAGRVVVTVPTVAFRTGKYDIALRGVTAGEPNTDLNFYQITVR